MQLRGSDALDNRAVGEGLSFSPVRRRLQLASEKHICLTPFR